MIKFAVIFITNGDTRIVQTVQALNSADAIHKADIPHLRELTERYPFDYQLLAVKSPEREQAS